MDRRRDELMTVPQILAELGGVSRRTDYDDVVETLEREGVEKFAKSFQQLFADVEAKKDALKEAVA